MKTSKLKKIFDAVFVREYCYLCKKKHSMHTATVICDFIGRIDYE